MSGQHTCEAATTQHGCTHGCCSVEDLSNPTNPPNPGATTGGSMINMINNQCAAKLCWKITRLSNSLTASHTVLCCPLAFTPGTGWPSMAISVQKWSNEAKNALVPSTKSDFFKYFINMQLHRHIKVMNGSHCRLVTAESVKKAILIFLPGLE